MQIFPVLRGWSRRPALPLLAAVVLLAGSGCPDTPKAEPDQCDTEPAGAYPKCRSRFGVFDQHGNVAEIMTRLHWDGFTYDQLKGSAFHSVDVQQKPTDPGGYWTRYPDHCNFEPLWHVERIETAAHVNYHLGFRCCKTIARTGDAGTR